MYTGNTRNVVGVWVFTYYSDDVLNVTQTTPDKELFAETREGIKKIKQWTKETLQDQDKCPYSPRNPAPIDDDGKMGATMTEGPIR